MDPNLASELNGGEDEDEALRRAIALSMGEDASPDPEDHGRSSTRRDRPIAEEAMDLTSPSPEPSGPLADATINRRPSPQAADDANATATAAGPFSFLGLDRKKMEEERLARMAKRKATEADVGGDERPQQRPKVLDSRPSGTIPPQLSRAIAKGKANAQAEASVESAHSKASSQLQTLASALGQAGPRYTNGVVKRTWLRGQPKTSDDVTIDDVLQKDDLQMAVLSSFQWDTDWLWRKINPKKTKVTLVAFAGNEAEKAAVVESAQGIARLCFPPMNGMGNMHSKLQLLKFPGFLRIVVPSGNLVSYDWGETGTMENVVFIIDLPLLSDLGKSESNPSTPFGEDLCYFLRAQGLEASLVTSLQKYDFSQTSRYGFVHTIAGFHVDDSWKRTGYCGLGRVIQQLGLATEKPIEVDFVASSIGSLNHSVLTALYNACQGDSGMKEYESRAARSKSSKDKASSGIPAALAQKFRVYFPSLGTVEASRGGRMSAGTICMKSRWWNLPTFPRELFRDYTNPRRALVHSKVIFVRGPDGCVDAGWAYVGSANLSESAWGKLVKDRATSSPKMSCRNWECGVVVPAGPGQKNPKHQGQDRAEPAGTCGSLDGVFKDCVPLPMELPGTAYFSGSGGDQKLPWFFDAP